MIKERSLSVGKIYHRESNVPEVSPFHIKTLISYKLLSRNNKHMPWIHPVPEIVKVCLLQILNLQQHNSP